MKSGFIAVTGKANAGKSTLVNTLVGEKVSIVSHKPQTTRNKIFGILNGDGYQAVFIDTPGLHRPKNALSEYMMQEAEGANEGVDAAIYVLACDKEPDGHDDEHIAALAKSPVPFILAVNKCDVVDAEVVPLRIARYKDVKGITAIVPVSARTGKNVDVIKNEILKVLPEGERYFDEDMYTDKNMRFMAAEIIREKALYNLSDEVPYGIGVNINKYSVGENGVTEIDADIICEKRAHKPIIIGKGGSMLKKIGSDARFELERLVGGKVFLTLWVRIKPDWRDDGSVMRMLGYDPKKLK